MFKQKKEEPLQELDLKSLKSNIEQQYNLKIKELQENLTFQKQWIDKEILNCKQDLDSLKKAELRNKNIPEREKHFMEGNREAFFRSTNILLAKIKKDTLTHENANWMADLINQEINLYSQNTARQFNIVKEFFSHEALNIAKKIKAIEECAKKIKNLMQGSDLLQIKKILDDVELLQNTILRKKDLEKNMSIALKTKETLKNKKEDLEKKEGQLHSSEDYKNFNLLKKQKDELNNNLKTKEESFNHQLHNLEAGLKKYERITLDYQNLIKGYRENPMSTLLKDKNRDLIPLLEKLKQSILKDEIELRDKKREKTIIMIESINEDQIKNIAYEFKNVELELNKIIDNIEKSPVTSKLNDIEDKKIELEREDKSSNIVELKRKKDQKEKSIQNLKNSIKQKYQNLFKKEINLTLS